MDIQNRIRDIMGEVITEDYSNGQVSEQELLQKLKQRGLVDDILQHLQFDNRVDGQGMRRPATHFQDKDDKVTNLPVKRGIVHKHVHIYRYNLLSASVKFWINFFILKQIL